MVQEPSQELAARFQEVTKAAGASVEHRSIEVMMGRKLDIPLAGACLIGEFACSASSAWLCCMSSPYWVIPRRCRGGVGGFQGPVSGAA